MRYTGSGPLALATALRKDRTKALLRAHGVPTPARRRQRRRHAAEIVAAAVSAASSSRRARTPRSGIALRLGGARSASARRARRRGARALPPAGARSKRFIDGRELYVSLLGNGDALDRAADARDRLLGACPPARRTSSPTTASGIPRRDEYNGTTPMRAEVRAEVARALRRRRARRLRRARAVATTRASICASPPTARPTSSTSTPTAISPTAPASAARPRSAGSPIPISSNASSLRRWRATQKRSSHVVRDRAATNRCRHRAPLPAPLAIRPLQLRDRAPLHQLLTKDGLFTREEVAVALELIDGALAEPGGEYRVLVAELDGARSPATSATARRR